MSGKVIPNTKKALAILFLVVVTELIGFGLIIPVLPQLGLQFSLNYIWLGVLMAAYSAAQFVAAPVLGSLSDRFGRKPILVLSKIGTIIGYLILAMSNSYGLFLLSRLIDGFTGGNISVARAYVADVTTPEDRPRGMAVIGVAFGLGFTLGPAIGGFLFAYPNGQFLAAMVSAGFSLVALIFTVLFLEEPSARQKSIAPQQHFFRSLRGVWEKWIGVILVVQWLYMMIFSGFETSFSVFTKQIFLFDARQNSWLFVFIGVFSIFVQGFITRRKWKSPRRMLLFGVACVASAFGLLAGTQHLLVLLLALAMLALGIGLIGAFLPSILSMIVDKDRQGVVMGVYEGIGSLSRVLGPLVVFGLFTFGVSASYFVFSSIMAVLGIGLLLWFKPTLPSVVK